MIAYILVLAVVVWGLSYLTIIYCWQQESGIWAEYGGQDSLRNVILEKGVRWVYQLDPLPVSDNMKASHVYLVRLIGNMLILAAFLGIYIFMLRNNQCEFPAAKFYFGVFAEMLFFGGLGLCFYGLSDNLVIGYMAPIVYYITAIGGGNKYLKMFYPFSMSMGRYAEKIYLFAAAVLLLAAGIYCRCRRAGGWKG